MTTDITIEGLEALAAQMEADAATHAAKLERLIRAFARIINGREPQKFTRKPTEYGDEAGHYDNSFPPEQEYRAHTGPRLIRLEERTTEEVATSSGFYYSWKLVTTAPGLYVAPDGSLWGSDATGAGRLGQFAAHPGDCGVEVTIDYDRRGDVSLDELERAEMALRDLAFPLIAAAQAGA
jgi:hypothetical protein